MTIEPPFDAPCRCGDLGPVPGGMCDECRAIYESADDDE